MSFYIAVSLFCFALRCLLLVGKFLVSKYNQFNRELFKFILYLYDPQYTLRNSVATLIETLLTQARSIKFYFSVSHPFVRSTTNLFNLRTFARKFSS